MLPSSHGTEVVINLFVQALTIVDLGYADGVLDEERVPACLYSGPRESAIPKAAGPEACLCSRDTVSR